VIESGRTKFAFIRFSSPSRRCRLPQSALRPGSAANANRMVTWGGEGEGGRRKRRCFRSIWTFRWPPVTTMWYAIVCNTAGARPQSMCQLLPLESSGDGPITSNASSLINDRKTRRWRTKFVFTKVLERQATSSSLNSGLCCRLYRTLGGRWWSSTLPRARSSYGDRRTPVDDGWKIDAS